MVGRRVRRQRRTDHDDPVGNNRRRAVADPADEIAGEVEIQRFEEIHLAVLSETGNRTAGLLVQRNQPESRRDRHDAFVVAIFPISDAPRIGAGGARFPVVLRRSPCPERFAGTGIRRNNRAVRTQWEIEDAVDHDRSDFGIGVSEVIEFPAPCNLEILNVTAVDQIER